MRFSISTGCGYPEAIDYGASLPGDVQTITDARFQELLAGRAAGQLVVAGANGKPVLVDQPPPDAMALMLYANGKQWDLVGGGFTVTLEGTPRLFACDATSAAFMASKLQRLALPDPPTSFKWQLLTGDYIDVQASDFPAVAMKLEAYVQATFDTCASLVPQIFGGVITSFAQIDAAAWPANHE